MNVTISQRGKKRCVPEHRQISLKMPYLDSKVGFIWGIEIFSIIFVETFSDSDEPEVGFFTIGKPTDVADAECLDILHLTCSAAACQRLVAL